MNYPSGFPGTAAVQNTAFIDQSCPSTWNAPPNMPPAWEPASYVNSTVSIVTARLPLCAPLQKPSQCMPVCPLPITCMFLVISSSSLMYMFGAGVGSTAFSQLLVRVVTQLCLLNGKIDHFFFFCLKIDANHFTYGKTFWTYVVYRDFSLSKSTFPDEDKIQKVLTAKPREIWKWWGWMDSCSQWLWQSFFARKSKWFKLDLCRFLNADFDLLRSGLAMLMSSHSAMYGWLQFKVVFNCNHLLFCSYFLYIRRKKCTYSMLVLKKTKQIKQ